MVAVKPQAGYILYCFNGLALKYFEINLYTTEVQRGWQGPLENKPAQVSGAAPLNLVCMSVSLQNCWHTAQVYNLESCNHGLGAWVTV